jgi:hypothetical protein
MTTPIRITLLAGAFLSFSAYAWTPYNYQIVELSGTPQFDKPIHVAIRTPAEWLAFTKSPGDWPPQNTTPAPQPPIAEIDFDRYSLVIIGIGARTGYQLAISDIRDLPNEIQVRYAVLQPGPNCAVAQVLGHPSVSVLIPKTTKPVRFNETAAAIDCCNHAESSQEMRELLGKAR